MMSDLSDFFFKFLPAFICLAALATLIVAVFRRIGVPKSWAFQLKMLLLGLLIVDVTLVTAAIFKRNSNEELFMDLLGYAVLAILIVGGGTVAVIGALSARPNR